MKKKQYIQPETEINRVHLQNILAASDGQKMLDYSNENGSVNYDDDDDEGVITKSDDIW